jgi:lipopolysaccharide export system permease protein
MPLLNRYLISQFIRYFFILNVAFVALYVLIDFFEKYDEFDEAGKPLSLVLQFFLFNIPYVVDLINPILILLSGVITLGILNHSNELIALKAAGIPLRTIIRPLLLISIIFVGMFIAMAQFVLPSTIARTNNIWFEQVRGKVPLGIYRNGRYYYKGQEGFYSFQWPNSKNMVFKDFSYSEWDENYNIQSTISVAFADWVPPHWILKNGRQIYRSKDGRIVDFPFEISTVKLPETPEDFLVPEYEINDKSLTALYKNIHAQEAPYRIQEARAEFYGRLSYLFLGIPLLLLGLPILMLSYQTWGKDLSVAIPISCVMAFVAWGIYGALQSFATAGYIMALPAALTVHIVFSAAGICLLRNQDR